MTRMFSILSATGDGEYHWYPAKPDVTAMANRIVQYFPMLKDREMDPKNAWVYVFGNSASM